MKLLHAKIKRDFQIRENKFSNFNCIIPERCYSLNKLLSVRIEAVE